MRFFNNIYVTDHVDYKVSQKIILCHSNIPIDHKNRDGETDFISNASSIDKHHYYYLQCYLKKYYLNDSEFKPIKQSLNYLTREVFVHLRMIQHYYDILFLNSTDANPRCLDSGWFFIPSQITMNQYRAIQNLLPYFLKFNHIMISGRENETMDTKQLFTEDIKLEGEQVKQLLDFFPKPKEKILVNHI